MARKEPASIANAVVLLLLRDPDERDAMRSVIAELGCAVLAPASVAAAETLLRNGAACHLIIVSTDAMENNPALFDSLMAAASLPAAGPPPAVVYSDDPAIKLVLHCLNRGAKDFLSKPFDRNDLVHTVENALIRDGSAPPEAIFASNPVDGWIELTASSELEQFRRLQRFSDSLFASNYSREMCDDLKMAVEEVGRNAVEWGNRFDPDKQVHVSYCLFDDRLIIKVEDEGEGFKPQSLPDPTADPMKNMRDRIGAGKRPGGYGVYLMRKLVDDIVYNEKGNTVLLTKYLPNRRPAPPPAENAETADPA